VCGGQHGFGKYKYVTGKTYTGTWHEDTPHGKGQLRDGDMVFDIVYDKGVVVSQTPARKAAAEGPSDPLGWLATTFACGSISNVCNGERQTMRK